MPKYISLANLEKFYNFISYRPVYAFDTVADMQNATYLEPGVTCHTNGYNTSGDGNAAYYKVGTSGNIALYNGLRASEIVTEAKQPLTNAEIDAITEGGN